MKQVADFSANVTFDHGQYWQGAGTSFTEWDECHTGIGSSTTEAYEDALNLLAENDWDVSNISIDFNDVGMECECAREDDMCEHRWFFTLYVR